MNPVGSRPTALSKITEKKREEKGKFEKKVEVARKNRKIALDKKRKAKSIRNNFDLDLWGQDCKFNILVLICFKIYHNFHYK